MALRFWKKTNPRRTKVRKSKTSERQAKNKEKFTKDVFVSLLIMVLFILSCVYIISFDLVYHKEYAEVLPIAALVTLVCVAIAFYIHHYQSRIIKNHTRAIALACIYILLLTLVKLAVVTSQWYCWGTVTAVTVAMILSIAYNQRFALGMSLFYCVLASFTIQPQKDIDLFLIMAAGAITCCFALREIRTRTKLLEVSALCATIVFVVSMMLGFMDRQQPVKSIFLDSIYHGCLALIAGLVIQGLLPVIERIFRIATSLTLIDWSVKNQPILRRLEMEAPGTNSHSQSMGLIAEAAADAIGCDGLLCRVGSYYHDIGKINKPGYFNENEMGGESRHKDLSPAMSQLIIVGHVKDGIELAKEYKLPIALRQFIETHHGNTLVEYFYNEAKKKSNDGKTSPPSESEFRYPGPKPKTKEAAIVMLSDVVESATRSLTEVTPSKIEAVVHNMAMKRLQDGQFDECDLSLRELNQIEASMTKTLTAHYHGRIAYPKSPDEPSDNKKENTNK